MLSCPDSQELRSDVISKDVISAHEELEVKGEKRTEERKRITEHAAACAT